MGVIENLKSFNRKERFYLIGLALDNRDFKLGQGFREALSTKLHINVPDNPFCAMDYHVDWIYASLALALPNRNEGPYRRPSKRPSKEELSFTQEDVDLLVAFEDNAGQCHIIMIEAKGDTNWLNRQLASKAKRLNATFDSDGRRWTGVTPHFVILSPRAPQKLKTDGFPEWLLTDGAPRWIPLSNMPHGLRQVTRCDSKGRQSEGGEFWKAE